MEKTALDVLLGIILFLLMSHNKIGILTHEILGVGLIALFVIHHLINRHFYKNLFKNKYNKLRIAYLTVDVLMLTMISLMIVSTFLISQRLFASLGLGNDYLGRALHIISSYSLFILCGLHQGLHYNSIVRLKKENKNILNVFLILFACVFGINGFIKRNFIGKLSLNIMYPIHFEEGMITWLVDYIGIFIIFMMIGYGIYNLAIKKRKEIKMNKKTLIGTIVAIVVVAIIGIVYFASSNDKGNKILENQTPNKINRDSKSLVVYFSVPETDDPNNMTRDEDNSVVVVDGRVLGNTEYVASLISEKTDSDLFRLEPVDAYPTDHQQLLDRARKEMQNDERPELKEKISLKDYETIFIGYPIWNADLPPIIDTFLESEDFDGKTVVPFCTHGGSGLSGTPTTIKNKLSNANVITDGFSLSRTNMEAALTEVDSWLSKIEWNK